MIKHQINKILVPLDGSKHSQRGLDLAISIARSFNATIMGIYSIHAPPHSEFKGVGSVNKKLNNEIKQIMEKAKLLSAQNGIVFKSKTLSGDIGFNILKVAHNKKEKFDLIVIGSRGRGSVKGMFFGSVSNYVIHASKIPVLVVK